ncbi:MAG: SPOR domain-containing protein, partial [Burkholderiaceae bacterium]|nr:SPOR domain-containing protein [Burkholderiaceae bacterium]
ERTRVRVGPFDSRVEAEKARATLKLAGIDSSVVDAR